MRCHLNSSHSITCTWGTPKSSIFMGFSLINNPAIGHPRFQETSIYRYIHNPQAERSPNGSTAELWKNVLVKASTQQTRLSLMHMPAGGPALSCSASFRPKPQNNKGFVKCVSQKKTENIQVKFRPGNLGLSPHEWFQNRVPGNH
jgi:hypothetical protein